MHQWVQQKELNNKNEQSVVIIILVATLFFRHFLRKQLHAALEAVISMDMVSRHIKRQEKKYDSLMVNLEYTIPKNRLDF